MFKLKEKQRRVITRMNAVYNKLIMIIIIMIIKQYSACSVFQSVVLLLQHSAQDVQVVL